jgi:hypothetical protein
MNDFLIHIEDSCKDKELKVDIALPLISSIRNIREKIEEIKGGE